METTQKPVRFFWIRVFDASARGDEQKTPLVEAGGHRKTLVGRPPRCIEVNDRVVRCIDMHHDLGTTTAVEVTNDLIKTEDGRVWDRVSGWELVETDGGFKECENAMHICGDLSGEDSSVILNAEDLREWKSRNRYS